VTPETANPTTVAPEILGLTPAHDSDPLDEAALSRALQYPPLGHWTGVLVGENEPGDRHRRERPS
jgi:hypothetical protein